MKQQYDSTAKGAIIGLLLPLIICTIIILVSSSKFDSVADTFNHFKTYGLLYKILSISLMPGAGLFLFWSQNNKINQARGTLLMTLFYGVFVVLLYFT